MASIGVRFMLVLACAALATTAWSPGTAAVDVPQPGQLLVVNDLVPDPISGECSGTWTLKYNPHAVDYQHAATGTVDASSCALTPGWEWVEPQKSIPAGGFQRVVAREWTHWVDGHFLADSLLQCEYPAQPYGKWGREWHGYTNPAGDADKRLRHPCTSLYYHIHIINGSPYDWVDLRVGLQGDGSPGFCEGIIARSGAYPLEIRPRCERLGEILSNPTFAASPQGFAAVPSGPAAIFTITGL